MTAAAANLTREGDIMLALWRGITAHFRLRAASWIMSGMLFGIGIMLYLNPHIFTGDIKAYQYVYLNRIIGQDWWAFLCTSVGVIRLLALLINGTFPAFTWSPHIRALGSALACFLWLQIGLGVWAADAWNTAMPIYAGLLLFDVFNTYAAMLEIDPGA